MVIFIQSNALYQDRQNSLIPFCIACFPRVLTSLMYPSLQHITSKKQTFKNMTTRKHYPGEHQIVLIINGEEKQRAGFVLN